MDRDIPSFNRAVMQKIYAKNHELHLKRLKNIRSGISSHKTYNKPTYSQLNNSNPILGNNQLKLPQYNNLKKEVNQEAKNAQIDRQNALLFQKMTKIMKRPDKNNDPYISRPRGSTNVAKQRLSMEFTRINEQNRAFYHRLQQQRPTIDNKKLEQQRLKNLNILKFLGKYPNQDAISRATQYKTFELKSKRIASSSNRVHYNNVGAYCYQEGGDMQQDNENYDRFRSEMLEYDQQIRELKIQQQRVTKGMNKFNATTAGYYKGGKNQQGGMNQTGNAFIQNQEYPNEMNQMNAYQPVVPSRRKFLSQGANRRTSYQEKFVNHNLGNVEQFIQQNHQFSQQDHDQQPYPYHLNHPSHNIIIEDRHAYNQTKKSTIQSINNRPTLNSTVNSNPFQKPLLPNQRRLNTKNSKTNLLPPPEEKSLRVNYANQSFRQEEIEESIPTPKIAVNIQGKNSQKNHNQHQSTDQINSNHNAYASNKQQNMILLYKSVIPLNQLLVKQEKYELLKDILSDINQGNSSENLKFKNSEQNLKYALDKVLLQYSPQISIYRLSDCYKISIQNKPKIQLPKRSKQQSKSSLIAENSQQFHFDQSTLALINQLVGKRLQEIIEVQIPQVEGSMLLEEIDYDYKYLIKEMVKIEKDIQNEETAQQTACYRLVIVLKEQQDSKNQQQQLYKQLQNNVKIKQMNEEKQRDLNKNMQENDNHLEIFQQSLNDNRTSDLNKQINLERKQLKKQDSQDKIFKAITQKQNSQGNPGTDSDQQDILATPKNRQHQEVLQQTPINIISQQNNDNYVEALDEQVL